jgi:hypothetical protein
MLHSERMRRRQFAAHNVPLDRLERAGRRGGRRRRRQCRRRAARVVGQQSDERAQRVVVAEQRRLLVEHQAQHAPQQHAVGIGVRGVADRRVDERHDGGALGVDERTGKARKRLVVRRRAQHLASRHDRHARRAVQRELDEPAAKRKHSERVRRPTVARKSDRRGARCRRTRRGSALLQRARVREHLLRQRRLLLLLLQRCSGRRARLHSRLRQVQHKRLGRTVVERTGGCRS